MLALILEPDEFRTVPEIAAYFGQNESTVHGAISRFKNELRILDYDAGGYYRLAPGRELEAWAFYYFGWDAFEATLRESAVDALLNRPELRAHLGNNGLDELEAKYQQRLVEFR